MRPTTDYEEQTSPFASRISDTVINATRTIICYDQAIYDDDRLEPIEYAGLGLSANPENFFINPSSVLTVVRPMYDDSVICIVDDDGKCMSSNVWWLLALDKMLYACINNKMTVKIMVWSQSCIFTSYISFRGCGGSGTNHIHCRRGCGCGGVVCYCI